MKIILLILLTSCTLLNAEYKRHKIRGPPHPHRIPPSQQFAKKWHQQPQHPPRNPVRSRPIPVHMPTPHKLPKISQNMGIPQAPPRNVGPPMRNYWKNNVNNVKFPPKEPYPVMPKKDKPFLAAPSIQEFDYHIQTNSIPTTHTNPIKQVGEKGPIHTIPAPNLSLRDKPIVVEEVRYQYSLPHVKVAQSHQYQVTEQPEPATKQNLYRAQPPILQQQQLHQQLLQQEPLLQQELQKQQIQHQHLQQQLQEPLLQQEFQKQQIHQQHRQQHLQEPLLQQELQKQVEVQPQQLYYTTDAIAMPFPTQKTPQGEIYLSSQLNPKELYQLIGAAYPQQGAVQSQDLPKSFFQQTQQVPNYEALLTQQLFQAEQNYAKSTDNLQAASEKMNFQPEFHSFNYDEQAHQKSQKGLTKEQLSSLVTAAYNLDGRVAPEPISARNSLDPVAQAQLVQSYFDTRSDVVENDVEPDAKPSSKENQGSIKDQLLSTSYFSSLPNKEAAERLAELQAAGKINSNLMQLTAEDLQDNESENVSNYEEKDDGNDNQHYDESSKDQSAEYEDYSQEEQENEPEEQNEGFGHRLQSKSRHN